VIGGFAAGANPAFSATSEQSTLCSVFLLQRKTPACSLAPPFPQKVTLGSPAQLQAPSQRLAVATNFLRLG
jgi:hypothetical protein